MSQWIPNGPVHVAAVKSIAEAALLLSWAHRVMLSSGLYRVEFGARHDAPGYRAHFDLHGVLRVYCARYGDLLVTSIPGRPREPGWFQGTASPDAAAPLDS